jgi:hypothetical protein
MLFFGDIRSSFVLSSLLFKRYREEVKGSKYFIVCTWPGYEGLFPTANEVWTWRNETSVPTIENSIDRFENSSDLLVDCRKHLNWVFNEVVGPEVLALYYNDGITQDFLDKFKLIKRTLLNIPSATLVGQNFNQEMIHRQGYKVFVWPSLKIRCWDRGKLIYLKTPKEFWLGLLNRMIKEGLVPVVYHSDLMHDVSMDLAEKCIYLSNKDMLTVMGAMRAVGCVLDVFTGIDRFAIEARTPFVSLDERARYYGQKENEIDGLCCEDNLPRKYIFLFPTIISGGDSGMWNLNIYDPIMAKILRFLPTLDRANWPSPTDKTELVLYEKVTQKKMKRIGTKFIKVIDRE